MATRGYITVHIIVTLYTGRVHVAVSVNEYLILQYGSYEHLLIKHVMSAVKT